MSRSTMRLALALAAILAAAAGPASKPTADAADEQSAVERALDKKIRLDLVEVPLKDAAVAIATLGHIDVRLDTKTLQECGVTDDTPITFNIADVPLRGALRRILVNHCLGYRVEGDKAIVITSDVDAKSTLVVRTYGAADFAAVTGPEVSVDCRLDWLIDVIKEYVASAGFSDAGGKGTIEQKDAVLKISATENAQEEIGDLLTQLRRVRDQPKRIIDADPERPRLSVSPFDEAIERRMRDRLDFDFEETPLTDVADWLCRHGVPAELDPKSIKDAGISPDEPVTYHAKQVRIEAALAKILADRAMVYFVQDGIVLFEPSSGEEGSLTYLYPVGDLVESGAAKSPAEVARAYESLKGKIVTTVAPTSWPDSGGIGSLTAIPQAHALICRQTPTNHEQICRLLADLRAAHHADKTPTATNPQK